MAENAELNIKVTADGLEQQLEKSQQRIDDAAKKQAPGIEQKGGGGLSTSGAMIGAMSGGGTAGAIGGAIGGRAGPIGAIIGAEVGKAIDEKFIAPLKDLMEAKFMDLIGVTEDNGKAAKAFYAKSPKWFADIVVGLEGVMEAIITGNEQKFSDSTVGAWKQATQQASQEIKKQNFGNDAEWRSAWEERRAFHFQQNQAQVSQDAEIANMGTMKELEAIEIMYSKESMAAEKRVAVAEYMQKHARETGTTGRLGIGSLLPGGG